MSQGNNSNGMKYLCRMSREANHRVQDHIDPLILEDKVNDCSHRIARISHTWITDNYPHTRCWVRRSTANAELAFFVVDVRNETLTRVAQFLEDVNDAGNLLSSDIIGENLYSCRD